MSRPDAYVSTALGREEGIRVHLVASYDVVRNSKRARLARYLRGFLVRVQKSVFEGEIDHAGFAELREGVFFWLGHDNSLMQKCDRSPVSCTPSRSAPA